MAIQFSCPQCASRFQVKDEQAGRKGKCPQCGAIIRIPEAAGPAAAGAPPSTGRAAMPPAVRQPPRPPGPAGPAPAVRGPATRAQQPPAPKPPAAAGAPSRPAGRPPRGKPKKKLQAIIAAAAGVVVLGMAGLLVWLLWPKGAEEAMRLAPPDARAICHIEITPLVDEVFPTLRQKRGDLGLPADLDLDQLEKTYRRIRSVDVFFVDQPVVPPIVIVVHTDLTPKEFQGSMRTFGGDAPLLKGAGNGRYDTPTQDDGPPVPRPTERMPSTGQEAGLRLIFGSEAADVLDGVILMGERKLLSDEYVGRFGKGANDALRSAASGVKTSAPIWAAGSADLGEPIGLVKVAGWLDPRGKASGEVRSTFDSERTADQVVAQLKGGPSSPGEMLAPFCDIRREGKQLVVALKPVDNLLSQALDTVARARTAGAQGASRANLHMIGSAARFYAFRSENKLPEDLDTLVASGDLTLQVLVSPAGGHGPPTVVDGKLVGQMDYVYLGAGHSIEEFTDPSKTILAYERPALYYNEGTNVLYVDGKVEWLAMPQFNARLASTTQILEKPQD